MSGDRRLDTEILRLAEAFQAAGAQLVDLPVLQPAETMLDLYGEDIRARAYTTRDPLAGELMLRPDFTVPVVQMHMGGGATPARYAYAGKVFRTQEIDSDRPSEYDQVGFEIFDDTDPAAADAEVFALMASVLAHLPLRPATGDIGILVAAVRGLSATDARKAALLRHIWRPRRFRALLDGFSGRTPVPPARADLIARTGAGADVLAGAGPVIGLRTRQEIRDRVALLAAEAAAPPLSSVETDLLDRIVTLRQPMPEALSTLRGIAADLPAIRPAIDRLEARMQALEARGIETASLQFEGGYGRASMEYYDGFVFGFYAEGRDDLPAVATGGRYDALVRALGGGAAIPAVGGVVRPALTLMVEGGAE